MKPDPRAGAVLVKRGEWVYDDTSDVARLNALPDSIGVLADEAAIWDARAVWLLSPHDDPAWWADPAVRFAPPPLVPGEAPTMASVKAGAREVFVCDAARDVRWPWAQSPSPAAALATIARIEEALDAPLTWTPATVGLRLMQATYGYRKADSESAARTLDFRGTVAPLDLPPITPCALHWARPVAPQEGAWWHFYDLNAAYVAAMQSTPLGALQPVKATFSPEDSVGRRAGIWQCAINGRGVNPVIRWDGWYDTAIVRAALAADPQSVNVGGGWVWPVSPYGLRRFADRVWGARVACQEAGDTVGVQAVKAIYTQAFGSLNSARRGDAPSPYYRPHWYEAVRGESTRRTWAAVGGYDAFLANVDMIGIAAPQADPLEARGGLVTRRATGLGGWKPALSLQPSAALRAQAAAGALSASQLLKACREEAARG